MSIPPDEVPMMELAGVGRVPVPPEFSTISEIIPQLTVPPLSRQQIAAVRLDIADDNADISRSQGLAIAMMADENLAWVFFEDEQPDTDYIVTPGEGVAKFTDHIEIATDGASRVLRIVERIQ